MLDGIILPLTPILYPATRTPPDVSGQGYLAGDLPDGLTQVEGVPTSATIRVHLRRDGLPGDGMLVAETTSAEGGNWLIPHLNPDMKFDVICRYPGYNDMILSNVSPVLATGLEFAGSFTTLDDQVEILQGTGPYQVDVVDGALPPGVEIQVAGDVMALVGTPGEWGQFSFVVRVIDSAGISGVFASELEVVEPLPTIIGEPFGGGFYAGDIESDGQWYKLIVADKSADITGTNSRWKTSGSNTPNTGHLTDGVANTAAMIAAGIELHPAAKHCTEWGGGGYTDWYMPSKDELNVIYLNLGYSRPDCPPDFKASGSERFEGTYYWASTQSATTIFAWMLSFDGGVLAEYTKASDIMRVRPVRRLQFTPEAEG